MTLTEKLLQLDAVNLAAKRNAVGKAWQRVLWRRDTGDKDWIKEFYNDSDTDLTPWKHIDAAYDLLNSDEKAELQRELDTEYPPNHLVKRDTPSGLVVDEASARRDCLENFLLDRYSRKWIGEFKALMLDAIKTQLFGTADDAKESDNAKDKSKS